MTSQKSDLVPMFCLTYFCWMSFDAFGMNVVINLANYGKTWSIFILILRSGPNKSNILIFYEASDYDQCSFLCSSKRYAMFDITFRCTVRMCMPYLTDIITCFSKSKSTITSIQFQDNSFAFISFCGHFWRVTYGFFLHCPTFLFIV